MLTNAGCKCSVRWEVPQYVMSTALSLSTLFRQSTLFHLKIPIGTTKQDWLMGRELLAYIAAKPFATSKYELMMTRLDYRHAPTSNHRLSTEVLNSAHKLDTDSHQLCLRSLRIIYLVPRLNCNISKCKSRQPGSQPRTLSPGRYGVVYQYRS